MAAAPTGVDGKEADLAVDGDFKAVEEAFARAFRVSIEINSGCIACGPAEEAIVVASERRTAFFAEAVDSDFVFVDFGLNKGGWVESAPEESETRIGGGGVRRGCGLFSCNAKGVADDGEASFSDGFGCSFE